MIEKRGRIVMSKIIFLDVDGTLVDYEGRIPQSAVDAIRQARGNGHRVYICTGRSKAEVYDDIWNIGIDGMIGGNGSYVEDNGEVIMHRHITKEQAIRIVDWLNNNNLDFYLESNSGLYASSGFEEGAKKAIAEYSRRKGRKGDMTVKEAYPDMIYGGELYRDDINKISYVLKSYDDYIRTSKQFLDMQNGTWGGVNETALFGDIGLKNITKASAIEALLKHLNMTVEDTIAFGDARIDIPMLEYCNVGVAMGNGGEEIKKIADYITDDVNADGLKNAFMHLKLI